MRVIRGNALSSEAKGLFYCGTPYKKSSAATAERYGLVRGANTGLIPHH
jgi:hypothetical protein